MIHTIRHGPVRARAEVPLHRHRWRKGYYLGLTATWACAVCGRPRPPRVGPAPGRPGSASLRAALHRAVVRGTPATTHARADAKLAGTLAAVWPDGLLHETA